VRQDDEIALSNGLILRWFGQQSELDVLEAENWDLARFRRCVNEVDVDFGFGGLIGFVESSERIPESPQLHRDERGPLTLRYDISLNPTAT